MRNGILILKKICYTEKFTAMTQYNRYAFDVDVSSTKSEIAEAIHSSFGFKPQSINTIRRDGKIRRNKMKRGSSGRTANRKIAIVTLKSGDKIEMIGV